MTTDAATETMWRPDAETVATANIARFMRAHGFTDPVALQQASQDDPEWFWNAVVEHLGIEFSTPYTKVVDASDPPFSKWFVGGKLNLAWNCVHKWALGRDAATTAIVWEGEDGGVRRLTFADLRRDVSQLADAFTKLGIGPGDAVGIYLPMVPEVCVAMYACAMVGAMAVPVFSGFAAEAVGQRLGHCKAKAVVCADGTVRRGKQVPMKATIDEAVADLDHVEHVIVWRRLGSDVPWNEGRDRWWHELVGGADASKAPLELDSEHPFLLAYTSGTTGTPKAAVHVHGGFLVKIAQEAHFQTDIRPRELLHWVTDMGWIMGPWEVIGAHANGAAVLLYEGAPDYPKPDRLWNLVEAHGVNVLGVSPTLIRSIAQHGDELVQQADLSSVRIFGSTGEPWNPEPWTWLFETVGKGRCPIINLSGGTEVGACFLSPSPLTPLYPCSLGWPALGMAMEVRDPQTGDVLGPGDGVGELVCTKPWPGMTRGFFGEGGRERYLDTYWNRWPGVWVHGDWASIDEHGYWYLHGRSDDTINVAGKRIGPAEYESILVDHDSVAEAAAVGIPDDVKGEVVVCFAVLKPGKRQSDRLRAALADEVGIRLGKAFKPKDVRVVKALPKTRSGKIVRRAIKAVVLGEELADTSAIENPESLRGIAREWAEATGTAPAE
jgi:acetyl-CoA synthetase